MSSDMRFLRNQFGAMSSEFGETALNRASIFTPDSQLFLQNSELLTPNSELSLPALFHPDHHGRTGHAVHLIDLVQRLAHVALNSLMAHHHQGDGLRGPTAFLNDR